jgi:hypothetical protein
MIARLACLLFLGLQMTVTHVIATTSFSSTFITDPRHSLNLTAEDRQKLIAKGYRILNQILNGNPVNHKFDILKHVDCPFLQNPEDQNYCQQRGKWSREEDRRAYLESLVAVIWALSDYTHQKGQGFMNGAYSLIDKDDQLYKFFEGYALLAGGVDSLSQLTQGSLNPINPFGNKFVYNRDPKSRIIAGSSHFKKSTISQIGVDIRFGYLSDLDNKAAPLPILPFQKTHFIFGQVTTLAGVPKTYLKWEFHGLSDISSWTQHAQAFFHSQKSREGKERSEKDIPLPIAQGISKFIAQLKSIESFDKNLLTPIELKIYQYLLGLKDIKKLKANQSFDLAGLFMFMKTLIKLEEPKFQDRRKIIRSHSLTGVILELMQTLEQTYHDGIFDGLPNIYYRTGNEVVIDLSELAHN